MTHTDTSFTEERDILLSLSSDMAAIRKKDDLFKVVSMRLRHLLSSEVFIINLIDPIRRTHSVFFVDREEIALQYPEYQVIRSQAAPIDDGIFDRVLASAEPVVFDIHALMEAGDQPNYVQMWSRMGRKQMVAMALRRSGDDVGTIWVYKPGEVNLGLLKGVSAQLSIVIANIIDNEKLQQREKEQSTLLAFSNALASVRDRAGLASAITRYLRESFLVKEFMLSIVNPDKKTHKFFLHDESAHFVSAPGFDEVLNTPITINGGIAELVFNSTGPLLLDIGAIHRSKKVLFPSAPFWLSVNIHRLLATPLRVGTELIGILFIEPDQIHDSLLSGVASQIAIAVANTLANERINHQLAEINNYRHQLEEENEYLQQEIVSSQNPSELIGEGAAMQKILNLLGQVAYANSTVLLLGETGTGKELIARAIHNSSPRHDKLMVKVNCAALPANLIESELFGHERGAFTGAHDRRIGKFELASKGTLFLDEVGEMPVELQAKLLRAIQEKEIERVGGKGGIKVDVRIIAATNRNLLKEVQTGRFRSDLYYRLNVFPVTLPPLRDRKEDIPLLVRHFINRHARNTGKKVNSISHRALELLMAYSWPGNIRELEHYIERCVLLARGAVIRETNLPPLDNQSATVLLPQANLKTLEENERDYILEVLRRCNGKVFGVGGAAQMLGIPVSTLNSKMKKLGIIKKRAGFSKKD